MPLLNTANYLSLYLWVCVFHVAFLDDGVALSMLTPSIFCI